MTAISRYNDCGQIKWANLHQPIETNNVTLSVNYYRQTKPVKKDSMINSFHFMERR